MVRDDALMTAARPHTKLYPDRARETLGLAITRAREAAGYPTRPTFANLAKISVRSLVKVETGDPVGPAVYEAVARALPGWDEDAPRVVLEGGPIPQPGTQPEPDLADETDGWTDEDEQLHQALTALLAAHGLKPTAEAILAMRAEWERQQTERDGPNESGSS